MEQVVESDYFDASYDDDDKQPAVTIYQIYELCLEPSFFQMVPHLVTLLFFSFVFRLVAHIKIIPQAIGHVVSALCGILVLYHISTATFLLLIYIFSLYLLMRITSTIIEDDWHYLTAFLCALCLIFNEFVFPIPQLWNETRGQHMIATMKVVSLVFDIKKKSVRTLPNFIEYTGYLLCPCNCLFGPWISFNTYKALFTTQSPLFECSWLKYTVVAVLKCVLFLTMSNCWSYYLIPNSYRWLAAYQEAFSFRTSHYFISFLSEAAMLAGGFGYVTNDKKKKEAAWAFEVTRPMMIEFPRSLVEVVVFWNMPMHIWLKNYVFLEFKPHGSFFAIIMTYVASSLLHGFNLRLAAVLLSLGFYTYVEYKLRNKLMTIYNACIGASQCKNCQHLHKSNIYVMLTNIMFSVLAIFHLAYLGCLLDNTAGTYGSYDEKEGVFGKWRELSFAGHWFLLFEFYIYRVI